MYNTVASPSIHISSISYVATEDVGLSKKKCNKKIYILVMNSDTDIKGTVVTVCEVRNKILICFLQGQKEQVTRKKMINPVTYKKVR